MIARHILDFRSSQISFSHLFLHCASSINSDAYAFIFTLGQFPSDLGSFFLFFFTCGSWFQDFFPFLISVSVSGSPGSHDGTPWKSTSEGENSMQTTSLLCLYHSYLIPKSSWLCFEYRLLLVDLDQKTCLIDTVILGESEG